MIARVLLSLSALSLIAAAPQAEKRHPHFGRKGNASVPD